MAEISTLKMGSKKGEKRGHYGPQRRAEIAVQNMEENPAWSVGKAMREAGFSEEYARQPQKFMATKTFQELANIIMPDIGLLEKHHEILNSNKLENMKFPLGITQEEIISMLMAVGCMVQKIFRETDLSDWTVYFIAPNLEARRNALDLAYKIKGHIKTGAAGAVVPVQVNFGDLRDKYK